MTGPSGEQGAAFSFESREGVAAYRRGEAIRAQALAAATELMLELAGIRAGHRVLDVAAGTGEQTLLIAARVGAGGHVDAVDVSAPMLEVAAEAARQAGLAGVVETRVADAQALDLPPDSFDAAVSRMGLMLVPDPAAALRGIRRALRPGGRLAAVVFSTPERNPLLAVPLRIAGRRTGRGGGPAARPGLFALGAPGDLERLYRDAGLREVSVQPVPAPRRFSSTAEAMRSLREGVPLLQAAMAQLAAAEREAAWTEIEGELRRFERPDGFDAPGEVLVGAGTK